MALNPNSKNYNVVKFVDIPSDKVTKRFLKQIEGRQTYSDQILKEHIYNIDDLTDADSEVVTTKELTNISQLCHNMDCGYFRIIFN